MFIRAKWARVLEDGTILTGTAPDAFNPSVEVSHEVEPYCGAYRLNQRIAASVRLQREQGGRTVVLSHGRGGDAQSRRHTEVAAAQ